MKIIVSGIMAAAALLPAGLMAQTPWYQGQVDIAELNSSISSPEVVDVTGNGFPDIVLNTQWGLAEALLFKNVGGGIGQRPVFEKEVVESSMSDHSYSKPLDLFQEGKVGIVMGAGSNLRYYYYDNEALDPGWTFRQLEAPGSQVNGTAESIQIADFDGNGLHDFLVLSMTRPFWVGDSTAYLSVWIQRNDGSGLFDKILILNQSPSSGYHAIVADLDGDGIDEIIYSGSTTAEIIHIHPNQDPKFTMEDLSGVDRFEAMKVANLNGDGRLDLVATQGPGLYALINNGEVGTIPTFTAIDLGIGDNFYQNRHFDVYDITGNGLDDVIAPTANRLRRISHVGENQFEQAWMSDALPGVDTIVKIKVADLDNDGVPEILTHADLDVLRYHYQNAGASLVSMTDVTPGDPAWDLGSEGIVQVVVKNEQSLVSEEATLSFESSPSSISFEPTSFIVPPLLPDEEAVYQTTFRYLSTALCGEEALAMAVLNGPVTNGHQHLYLLRIGEYIIGEARAKQEIITTIPTDTITSEPVVLIQHFDSDGGIVDYFEVVVEINHAEPNSMGVSLIDPDGRVAMLGPISNFSKEIDPYDNQLIRRHVDHFTGRVYDGNFMLKVTNSSELVTGHVLGWRLRAHYHRYDCIDQTQMQIADALDYFLRAKSSVIHAAHADTNQDGVVDSADVLWTILGK